MESAVEGYGNPSAMPRLNILVGIALMLVGSLAYGLPQTQDFNVLYTAFGGIVIATAGFVALRHPNLAAPILNVNLGVSLTMLMWSAFRFVPDLISVRADGISVIADLQAMIFAGLILIRAVREIVGNHSIHEQEMEALRMLDQK